MTLAGKVARITGGGIRVNSVSPGMVATKMTGFMGGKPESVTPLFVYLASDDARRVTGQALDAQGWRGPRSGARRRREACEPEAASSRLRSA